MRDLRHSLPADRYQAHAPIPSETRLDKYLLRWFFPLTFLRLVLGPGRAAGSAGRYGGAGAVASSGLVVQDLQQAVRQAGTSPEEEQRKDVWNTAVLGHGRRRVIDFTGISQVWLREAVKRWVAEELPTRRSDSSTSALQEHVHRAGELSASLRLHRDDHGDDLRLLGRADILALLSRLAHRAATGQISSWRRSRTCRQLVMILRECRALGLTRPGQPMAGLPDDFAIRRDDIPQLAADDEPGRALPTGVLNHLISALPVLEEVASPDIRAVVELLMDTGRRPAEICKLGWDCLDQDRDGKYALIYTDFKANRAGRRLPITGDTASVIIGQQQRVRARYPSTPASELAMFPRTTTNRAGERPLGEGVVAGHHRAWVDALAPLRLEDGREFDKTAVFLYAYRHSFAQRHADAGTPVDVLRDLMGHRSMSTTQGYYLITTKRVRAAVDSLATFQFDRGGFADLEPGPGAGGKRAPAPGRRPGGRPVRGVLRALQRYGRGRGLPVPVPLPGLRALPLRPLLPARTTRLSRHVAAHPRTCSFRP